MTEADVPAKPRKKTLLIVLAVVAAAVVVLVATLVIGGTGGHRVRYEIESSGGSANGILWSIDNGKLDKKVPGSGESTVHTPWSTTVRFTANNQIASLTTEVPEGTATCRIFLDGKKAVEDTTEGEATCQARISW